VLAVIREFTLLLLTFAAAAAALMQLVVLTLTLVSTVAWESTIINAFSSAYRDAMVPGPTLHSNSLHLKIPDRMPLMRLILWSIKLTSSINSQSILLFQEKEMLFDEEVASRCKPVINFCLLDMIALNQQTFRLTTLHDEGQMIDVQSGLRTQGSGSSEYCEWL